MLHPGEMLCGRYKIIKIIGKGGMSTVYQAQDLNTGRLLAVKDVDRGSSSANRVIEQSLAAEGRMLMQLSNPHLPRIYDIIENPRNFMLVMDFIEGESLDRVLQREGAQPMERVLDWGMQICKVLSYLHNQPTPIIYRDMKPANVMLQPNGRLMMIDFGTARTEKIGVAMRADTICIGTAGFAAPEQFGGIGQSTAKTDIFCLGATLYNMITGHNPCSHPAGILPLEKWNPELANTPISHIIYKCTRTDPKDRYQTAAELYDDLRRARNGTFVLNRTGKSASSPAGFRKPSLQKPDGQSTGMLSGLLQRGLSDVLTKQKKAPKSTTVPAAASPVNNRQIAYPVQNQAAPTPCAVPVQPEDTAQSPGRKLLLIGVLLAAVFLVFTVVMLVMSYILMAIVFLLLALTSAALAVLGAVSSVQEQTGA